MYFNKEMVENNRKHFKIIINFHQFSSCSQVTHEQKWQNSYKLAEEQPAFGCQPIIFFVMFLHEPYMSLSYAQRKKYIFDYLKLFLSFLTMWTHAQACIRWLKYTTNRLNLTTSTSGITLLLSQEIMTIFNCHMNYFVAYCLCVFSCNYCHTC